MDFEPSDKVKLLSEQLERFMKEYVYPAEPIAQQQMQEDDVIEPPVLKEIRAKAKEIGLWNLFLPDDEYGAGLNNLEYAPLCEIMGRSPMASRAFNCNAPDTGNMEILAEFGTPEQKKQWLEPLLEGEIRSCFSMTEPEVSGADPTGLRTLAERDGDEWVINGHKWFTSGAVGAKFAIVMTVSDPKAPMHLRGMSRSGPTYREAILMHAVARLALYPLIPNIQVSWVKEGLKLSQICLTSGANDLGGTLINESISTSAGATHGQLVRPIDLRRCIRDAGRIPVERSTLYQELHRFETEEDELLNPLDRLSAEEASLFGSYRQLTKMDRFRFLGTKRVPELVP